MTADAATASSVAERVARGAAFLDETRPGWWREITLDTLDLASHCNCIIGQLAGAKVNRGLAYQWAADQIGVSYAAEIPMGFEAPSVRGYGRERDAVPGEYAELTTEWLTVIKSRLAESQGVA